MEARTRPVASQRRAKRDSTRHVSKLVPPKLDSIGNPARKHVPSVTAPSKPPIPLRRQSDCGSVHAKDQTRKKSPVVIEGGRHEDLFMSYKKPSARLRSPSPELVFPSASSRSVSESQCGSSQQKVSASDLIAHTPMDALMSATVSKSPSTVQSPERGEAVARSHASALARGLGHGVAVGSVPKTRTPIAAERSLLTPAATTRSSHSLGRSRAGLRALEETSPQSLFRSKSNTPSLFQTMDVSTIQSSGVLQVPTGMEASLSTALLSAPISAMAMSAPMCAPTSVPMCAPMSVPMPRFTPTVPKWLPSSAMPTVPFGPFHPFRPRAVGFRKPAPVYFPRSAMSSVPSALPLAMSRAMPRAMPRALRSVAMPSMATSSALAGRMPMFPMRSDAAIGPGTMIPDEKRKTVLKGEALVLFFKKGGTLLQLPPPMGHFDDDLCFLFRETGKCFKAHKCLWRHYDFGFGMDYPTLYIKVTLFSRLERFTQRTYSRVSPSRPFELAMFSPPTVASTTPSTTYAPTPPSTSSTTSTAVALSSSVPQHLAYAPEFPTRRGSYRRSFSKPRRSGVASKKDTAAAVAKKTEVATYWRNLIASRLKSQKWAPAKKGVSKQRIRELLDAQYDICWDFNSKSGCARASSWCRWRHDKLVLSVAGDGAEYKLTVGHPTRVGLKVEVSVRPTGRSQVSTAFEDAIRDAAKKKSAAKASETKTSSCD